MVLSTNPIALVEYYHHIDNMLHQYNRQKVRSTHSNNWRRLVPGSLMYMPASKVKSAGGFVRASGGSREP
jgi:hypothetical protein